MKKSILYIQVLTFTLLFLITILRSIELYNVNKKSNEFYYYNDNRIIEESEFYETAINSNYEKQNSKQPYIPEGFTYLEGEWDNGFVIQDENDNQYVWVPCTNKKSNEIQKLERNDFSKEPFISKETCINEKCEDFILSSLENGGFYISRYEIGIENNLPVSKPNVEILGNITRDDAKSFINEMNKYENVHCELINGYAYDTTLSWLKATNEIKINTIKNKENIKTGRNKYNNVYDFTDNILEITSESSYGTVIIRGFLFNNDSDVFDNVLLNELEYDNNSFSRISIREQDAYYTQGNIMGFRTIIYK